tara:strand:- start:2 stop:259 length:258 start_codon:yes stop_codon:yes gene_type:complete
MSAAVGSGGLLLAAELLAGRPAPLTAGEEAKRAAPAGSSRSLSSGDLEAARSIERVVTHAPHWRRAYGYDDDEQGRGLLVNLGRD